jgi:hypothetical protein
MNFRNRITKLEMGAHTTNSNIFIDARSSEDFRTQIRSLIKNGLDPAGKKFVYVEDPLQGLYNQIKGVSGGLVRDGHIVVNHNMLVEAGSEQ